LGLFELGHAATRTKANLQQIVVIYVATRVFCPGAATQLEKNQNKNAAVQETPWEKQASKIELRHRNWTKKNLKSNSKLRCYSAKNQKLFLVES